MQIIHGLPGRLRLGVKQILGKKIIASHLESTLLLEKGVSKVQVNPTTGRLLIHYDPQQISIEQIKQRVKEILTLPPKIKKNLKWCINQEEEAVRAYELEKLPLGTQLGLTAATGLLLLYTHLKGKEPQKNSKPGIKCLLDFNSVLTLLTGIPIFRTSLDHAFQKKLSTELVAGAATITSLFLNDDGFGLSTLGLVYLNTLVRAFALERVRDRIRTMLEGKKPTARLVTSQGKYIVPGNQLAQESIFEVHTGERLPADGVIISGSGTIYQIPVKKQQAPQTAGPDQKVYAGSVLTEGIILVKALQVGEKTKVGRLIHHLKTQKVPADKKAIKKLNQLSLLSFATAAGYYFYSGNIRGALNVLVIGMPGAAGLAKEIPAEIGALRAASFGALVKSGSGITTLGKTDLLLIEDGAFLAEQNHTNNKLRDKLQALDYQFPDLEIASDSGCNEKATEKVISQIRRWQHKGHIVGLVGSSKGEAPLLAAVDVGIVKAIGDEFQIKSASIILTEDAPFAMEMVANLARNAKQISKENSWFSTSSSAIGYALGFCHRLTPFWTGIIQNLSNIAILLNSGRLLFPVSPDSSLNHLTKELACTSEMGLTSTQVRALAKKFGPNCILRPKRLSFKQILFSQLDNYMSKVLLALSGISLLLGKTANALMGSGVLLANTLLAVVQENRTQRSLNLLASDNQRMVRVIRNNVIDSVSARELVPGDVILLQAGDKVPADLRILACQRLTVEEGTLTGEATPVPKQANMPDKTGWLFSGTGIITGKSTAIVEKVGADTEIGKIAQVVGTNDYYANSPVYRRLDEVSHTLVNCGLIVSGLAITSGIIHGKKLEEILVNATSLAVSVIPDGLIPTISLALALGARRLSKRQILVRHIPCVDTLGCINTLCVDKTGTLTQNRMKVIEVFCPGNDEYLFRCASLCNNARAYQKSSGQWIIQGDGTESALLQATIESGFKLTGCKMNYQRIDEIPFNPRSKKMTVICKDKSGTKWVFTKGAPEVVLANCHWLDRGEGREILTPQLRNRLQNRAENMARGGRILALAYGEDKEQLIFSGFMGLSDLLRPGACKFVTQCLKAGITPIILTGDHPHRALAVAKKLNILPDKESQEVLTGEELEKMSDEEIKTIDRKVRLYARLSPLHKQRLVRNLKESLHVVGMIGDGVNDAPSMREAQVGIALGQDGTKVTCEVAPITLPKEGLTVFPEAIKEGRAVYDNIQKSLDYSLASNLGDGIVVILSAILGESVPIEPEQLLWINLIGDPFISWILANDKPHPGIMNLSPRHPKERLLNQGLKRKIIRRSFITGLNAFLIKNWSLKTGSSLALSRTLTMATLTIGRLWHLMDCRKLNRSIAKKAPPNPLLIYASGWMLLSTAMAIYSPWLQSIFKTVPLKWKHWRVALLGSATGTLIDNLSNRLLIPDL